MRKFLKDNAEVFVIREAKHSIVLVDNYIDDTVLKLFAKRSKNVSLSIYTKKIAYLVWIWLNFSRNMAV